MGLKKEKRKTLTSLAKDMGSTLLKGVYNVEAFCSNCKKKSLIRVERGVTVADWFKEKKGKCPFCGCFTLEEAKIKHGEDYYSKRPSRRRPVF